MTISFVTSTAYGNWLPGDLRGYVRNGRILPGDARLLELSQKKLKSSPICFTMDERWTLFSSLLDACDEFNYQISDVAIESWHLHWILFHRDDTIDIVVGRLKTRMRQALNRGRIWTGGYCGEPLFNDLAIEQAQAYIAGHDGCMMTNGRITVAANPRQSRGLTSVE